MEQEKARKQERRREREIGVCELFDGREGEKLKEREMLHEIGEKDRGSEIDGDLRERERERDDTELTKHNKRKEL